MVSPADWESPANQRDLLGDRAFTLVACYQTIREAFVRCFGWVWVPVGMRDQRCGDGSGAALDGS